MFLELRSDSPPHAARGTMSLPWPKGPLLAHLGVLQDPHACSAELQRVSWGNGGGGPCRQHAWGRCLQGWGRCLRHAGQEPLEVPRGCEGMLLRGLWKRGRLIAGHLGEGPKAGQWDGSRCMREEAKASIRPAQGSERPQWNAASVMERIPFVLRGLTSRAVKQPEQAGLHFN